LVSFILVFWVWTAKDRAHEYAILHELWIHEKWPDGKVVNGGEYVRSLTYMHDNAIGERSFYDNGNRECSNQ